MRPHAATFGAAHTRERSQGPADKRAQAHPQAGIAPPALATVPCRGRVGPLFSPSFGVITETAQVRHIVLSVLAAATVAGAASAQGFELSVYGGWQDAPHSRVYVDDPVIGTEDFLADWEGRSFEAPPYYGLRATWWQSETLGFGVDFTHSKVYPTDATLADNGYDTLEMTDGINILTANVYRRWPGAFGQLTPYVGGGIGASIPHVEVEKNGSSTFGYQVTGPAIAIIAGASYPINDQWAVFGEYKGTYSQNEAELDSGGTLQTDIVTNALNLGVSFNF